MRYTIHWVLGTVLVAVAVMSCRDDRTLMEPPRLETPETEMVLSAVDLESEIDALIKALLPEGGLRTAALRRWGNIQRNMEEENIQEAQAQALGLAEWFGDMLAEGHLQDPVGETNEDLPATAAEGVDILTIRLMQYVGLEDLPEGFFEAEDYGYGWILPGEETVVITENFWAAVAAGSDATEEPVFITIRLLEEEFCDVENDLTQARGCWEIKRYPEGEFKEDVVVEACAADTDPPMAQEDWESLWLHQKDYANGEGYEVRALPWVEPQYVVDCFDFFDDFGTYQTARQDFSNSILGSLGRRFADLLLPDPLSARERPMARGLGGLTGSFSEFFGAVPDPDLLGSISGVVSSEGSPLSGIAVQLTGGQGPLYMNAVTAADGSYNFLNLPPGTYTVTATVTDPAWSQSVVLREGEHATVDFNLTTSLLGSISGVVSVDGEPQEGFEITLWATEPLIDYTDEEGIYRFSDLPAGPYTVVARGHGEYSAYQSLDLDEGQDAVVEFRLGFPPTEADSGPANEWTMGAPTTPVDVCNGQGEDPCQTSLTITVQAMAKEPAQGVISPTWAGGTVYFYVLHPDLSFYIYIDSVVGSLADFSTEGVNYFYTWSIDFSPAGLPPGNVELLAVAEDSEGNRYRTDLNPNVTIVEGH